MAEYVCTVVAEPGTSDSLRSRAYRSARGTRIFLDVNGQKPHRQHECGGDREVTGDTGTGPFGSRPGPIPRI